jgi:Rrf2 family protein
MESHIGGDVMRLQISTRLAIFAVL